MKNLRICQASLLLAFSCVALNALADTPVALQPYLEYAPIKTRTGELAGTGGMGHALLVLKMTQSNDARGVARPTIIASEAAGLQSSVVAFDGATGKPLNGWHSGNVRPTTGGGFAFLSGTELPSPRVVAAFAGKPMLVVRESGSIERQTTLGSSYSSPVAIGGYTRFNRHDSSAAYFGGEDYRVHKLDFWNGIEAFGWPQGHSSGAQRVTTPALKDINGDGVPEAFSASGSSSAGFGVRANDGATGVTLWNRIFTGGYAANYVALGQINADAAFELVVVTRAGAGTLATVLDATTGTTEDSIAMPGSVSYGSAPVLADMNNDGLDEIIVATEPSLNVVGGSPLANISGFPADLGDVWISDSAPVVGDLTSSSPGPEIVLSTQVPGSLVGQLHIFGSNGSYILPRQSMQTGFGVTNAIADLDNDGRNELIVGGRAGTSGFLDSIWVFDLDRNLANPLPHGPVLWGQFGRNPERCNCSKISDL